MTHSLLDYARAGATIITATQRLSRALREAYNRAAEESEKSAWTAPRILPYAAWLSDLWNAILFGGGEPLPVLLDANQAGLVWQDAIAESPDGDGLLQIAATAAAAQRSWDLMHSWRLERKAVEAYATEDTRAFLRWADRFEAVCRDNGWLDETRCADRVVTRLASPGESRRLVCTGFDEFTPQQKEFLSALRCAGFEVIEARDAPRVPGNSRRVACSERMAELAAAANWTRSILERNPSGTVGVVVPDLQQVRPAVERIFADVLAPASVLPGEAQPGVFNVSAPPALASYPVIHSVLLALELQPDHNELANVGALLRSRYLRASVQEWTARGLLEAKLRDYGSVEVGVERVAGLARARSCPELASILHAWLRERAAAPGRQAPGQWARTFSALLRSVGWPGDSLDSAEFQTVERWRDLLSEFAKLETVRPLMTCSEAVANIRQLAEATPFQPESGPARIHILGMLETAGLDFDHLWVCGLDDCSWPGAAKPDPFLPVRLQREHGIPHSSPDRELEFARRVTERLLASAPDVVVSHALADGDSVLGPSALIRHIPLSGGRGSVTPAGASFAEAMRAAAATEEIEDWRGPEIAESSYQSGGTRVFEYQALCPFRAFAQLRLGAEPIECPVPGLSRADRGQLVHRALAAVWSKLNTHARLCSASGEELATLVRDGVTEAMGWLEMWRMLPPRFAAVEQRRLEALLAEWLNLEKQRAPFSVVEIEGEHQVELGGIRAKVKIDRVDRLESGGDVIIDYKTGRQRPSAWEGDRPEQPQLPVYANEHGETVAAVLFGSIRAGDLSFRGIACADGIVPGVRETDVGAKVAEWRVALERLGEEFRAGVATIDPKHIRTCGTCPLSALCRVNDADIPASALEGVGDENA